MPNGSYHEILSRAQKELTQAEQMQLVDELSQHAARSSARHSILELEGLGKHLWEGINPDEYVRKERDSWDG